MKSSPSLHDVRVKFHMIINSFTLLELIYNISLLVYDKYCIGYNRTLFHSVLVIPCGDTHFIYLRCLQICWRSLQLLDCGMSF